MKVFYFSGFGGNEGSETFKFILKNYLQVKFIIYDNINAEIAYKEIDTQLKGEILENQLFIGQSLGGFWAEYFAIKYNQKLILINPSLDPENSLKKYNLSSQDLEKYKNFKSKDHVKDATIILSENDSLVNPITVKKKYDKKAKFVMVEGDHKFTNFTVLKHEIDYFLS